MKRTSTEYDAVVIDSGINSMVAAALLAKAGWAVCIVERRDHLGGAVQTEITLPGFRHGQGPGLSRSSGMFVAEKLVKKHKLAIRFRHAS